MSTVHALFEAAVDRHGARIALVSSTAQLDYATLDERANQLAHHLQRLGVRPRTLVALYLDRGVDLVVAMFAVLKAGAAYVPIDPEYPPARVAFMLADASPALLVTHRRVTDPDHAIAKLYVDTSAEQIRGELRTRPAVAVGAHDLANVIYTSGSTGRPKGVLVEHGGLCNLAVAQARAFGVSPESRVLQFASTSFDACSSEVFVTLTAGATLVVASRDEIMPGPPLERLLNEAAVSHVTFPPSVLEVLDGERLPTLHTVISAGERCPRELVRRWSTGRRFLNAYGPTEGSVCATISDPLDGESEPPIGRAIDNVRVHVLDEDGREAPIGVEGELYIAGAGVTRGYLGRPALTAERFVPDPFASPGARMYRTGDRARRRADGDLEFLGRRDDQVKVRGHRIELGEIESALEAVPGVRRAAVVVRDVAAGDRRLHAFVVGDGLDAARLTAALAAELPPYMVPNAIGVVDELPQTPNGKVDRKALAHRDVEANHAGGRTPSGPIEETLASIWCELLGVDAVSLDDDFFALGAHSLLVMRLGARIREAFDVVIPLEQIFQAATLEQLSSLVTASCLRALEEAP